MEAKQYPCAMADNETSTIIFYENAPCTRLRKQKDKWIIIAYLTWSSNIRRNKDKEKRRWNKLTDGDKKLGLHVFSALRSGWRQLTPIVAFFSKPFFRPLGLSRSRLTRKVSWSGPIKCWRDRLFSCNAPFAIGPIALVTTVRCFVKFHFHISPKVRSVHSYGWQSTPRWKLPIV